MLDLAREAVAAAHRDGADPAEVAVLLHAAWAGAVDADVDFVLDPDKGVEGLGFVVRHADAVAGGLVLRLPGDFPDSYEAVAVDGLGPDLDGSAIRRAFFS
jgi:hypothetical protein